jgi:hypothetical protein
MRCEIDIARALRLPRLGFFSLLGQPTKESAHELRNVCLAPVRVGRLARKRAKGSPRRLVRRFGHAREKIDDRRMQRRLRASLMNCRAPVTREETE